MLKRRLYHIAFLLLVPALSSCAADPTRPDAPGGVRTVVIGSVPFYAQEIYQCGPASLAGVLNFWGVAATPEEIAREIYSASARGTLTLDMLLYAQKRGLAARHYRGSWDDLREKIDAGQPLIVLVDNGVLFYQLHHFMVVVGYAEDRLIVNSGIRERQSLDKERFLKTWEKTNFWTLWVQPN